MIREQARRTLDSPRRLLALIILLALFVAAALMLLFERAPQSVRYRERFPVASPAEVCPGETFSYPLSIDIVRPDTSARITAGWCRADGICPMSLQEEPYYINFVEPYSVHGVTARRTVPDLPPGEWFYRHCNEAHSTDLISVVCYQVAVNVRDCGG